MKQLVSVRIDPLLYKKVKMICIMEKVSVQEIVKKAFEDRIKRYNNEKEIE